MKAEDWTVIDITKEDGLPKIDEYVLWRTENGGIFEECIDKDMELRDVEKFLAGFENTGPITHFQRIVQPEDLPILNKESSLDIKLDVELRNKEVCFTIIYLDTGELRLKRTTPEWMLTRIFQSEIKTWLKNGELPLKLREIEMRDVRDKKPKVILGE